METKVINTPKKRIVTYTVPRTTDGKLHAFLSIGIPVIPSLVLLLPDWQNKQSVYPFIGAVMLFSLFWFFTASLRKNSGNFMEIVSPRRSELKWNDIFKVSFFVPVKTKTRVIEEFYAGDDDDITPLPNSRLITHIRRGQSAENARLKITHEERISWGKIELIQTVDFLKLNKETA
jgi:hypothetical protein